MLQMMNMDTFICLYPSLMGIHLEQHAHTHIQKIKR